MADPRCRDTSVERRLSAAAAVQRHLEELRSLVAADGLRVRVVDGSAVAVELFLADTNTLCTIVRVAVFVAPDDRRRVERTMARAGFAATAPSGDAALLRSAGRRGRRAIHVLFDAAGKAAQPDPSPTSAAAARARAVRLASAWIDPASTFRRVRHDAEETCDVTEWFEVQLMDRAARDQHHWGRTSPHSGQRGVSGRP